jgi:molybdate transport system ATP-binding protein
MSVLELDLSLSLDRFDLRVEAQLGEAVALLGPSGAGKSSLVECIAGLRPARGRIVLAGETLLGDGCNLSPEQRRIGWVPQDGALFPHLSVRRNVEFGAGRGGEAPSFDEVVAALELEPLLQRSPQNLSGGERRRVALARALRSGSRLLLLDEPTTGLDAVRARRALHRIRDLRVRFGVPLLAVTHREDEALALGDEVLLLDEGRVAGCGPAREVLRAARLPGVVAHGVNVAPGRVVAHDAAGGITSVALESGPSVSIPHLPELDEGAEVVLAADAEDVLVATDEPHALSARNAFEAQITALVEDAGTVLVEAGAWRALLTASASRALSLEPGRRIFLVVKTHGWRVLAG